MLKSARILSHAPFCTHHSGGWSFIFATHVSQAFLQDRWLCVRWLSSNAKSPEVEHFQKVDDTKYRGPQKLKGPYFNGALLEKAAASAKTSKTSKSNKSANLSNGKAVMKRKEGTPSINAIAYNLPAKSKFAIWKWTAQADEALKAAVLAHRAEGWNAVALHMGSAYSYSGMQCSSRWRRLMSNYNAEGLIVSKGPLSADEMRRLEELIPQHTGSGGRVKWTAIGAALNRMPQHCQRTWISLKRTTIKHGSLSAEEDALIMRRVAEWGDNRKRGLWVALGKEIGRDSKAIWNHWTYTLRNRLSAASKLSEDPTEQLKLARSDAFVKKLRANWTFKMHEALKEGVALYKETEGWDRVAEHVGRGVSAQQCKSRWYFQTDIRDGEKLKQEPWTEEEVIRLEQLVPLHITTPYTSETLGTVVSKATYDWVAIGKLLNRNAVKCLTKWHNVQASKMKQGRFSPDEDALIRRRVAEWGDKGRGLWVSLQEELGRSRSTIRTRWNSIKARV